MTRTSDVGFRLSRELWTVQIGIFLNALGWGAILPFEVYYLHNGRGFSLAVAGLVVGTVTGTAVVTAPVMGALIDRVGARAIAAGGGVALGLGYAGLAIAHTEQLAFASALLAGAGNGALDPAQSTLLAALAPPQTRHRVTAVSRVCINAGFGLGGGLGGLIASQGLPGLIALMLLNAITYIVYVAILVAVVRRPPKPERTHGGYRHVLADRPFIHLACTNVLMIGVGWGISSWIVPLYARTELGVSPELIGLLLLANPFAVVALQVPIARLAEGRSRAVMMAAGGAIFAAAYVAILVSRQLNSATYPALVAAEVAIAAGECFYTAALTPLVAALAPPGIRGRYMATIGFSWWSGLALAPIVGTQLFQISSSLTFAATAATGLVASASLLGLDRTLPAGARLTPHRRRQVPAGVPTADARGS